MKVYQKFKYKILMRTIQQSYQVLYQIYRNPHKLKPDIQITCNIKPKNETDKNSSHELEYLYGDPF